MRQQCIGECLNRGGLCSNANKSKLKPPVINEVLFNLFRQRLSAEGAKPESNNRWKSDLGHVCMYVWYLELSREPTHVAQQMRYQNVGLRNGHCLGTIS